MIVTSAIIDDLSCAPPLSAIGTNWRLYTDRVMGGVSQGRMLREVVGVRAAIRMNGEVSLANNGGFIQISLNLAPEGGVADASNWTGVELDVYGKIEEYSLRLRTRDLTEPWQSYRQTFVIEPKWRTIQFFFDRFQRHRTETPLNVRRLRRLGIVAIGRSFSADLALGGIRYFV